MKTTHLRTISLIATLAFTALAIGCSGGSPENAATPAKPSTTDALAASAPVIQYNFYTPTSEEDLRNETNYGYLIAKTKLGAKTQMFTDEGLKIVGSFSKGAFTYYHLQKDSDLLGTIERLKTVSGLVYVEPDTKLSLDAPLVYDNPDPRAVSEEYSLTLTKAKEAWTTYGFGPNRPVVVDIDTGVNFGHEDLTGVVKHAFSWWDLTNNTFINGLAGDLNVQPIDYKTTGTFTNTDMVAHGSHTAGTIAATGNNGLGVAGVCWNADLVSYKCFHTGTGVTGSGSTWAVYGSLYHLANWKATNYPHTIAVNMSLGGSSANNFAVDMVEMSLENGIAIIASMGNEGQRIAKYPAGYAGVIAVGASNGMDKKVHFSTYGRNISVTAPGYNIISTGNASPHDYQSMSGTSMSTPFVTGLVTYMLTFAPDLNPAQIRTYLEANTDFIEGATGFTDGNGWGRVNVLKTIGAVVRDVNAHTAPPAVYVNSPLSVTVQNSFMGGIVGYTGVNTTLYSCTPDGAITNYVASSITDPNATAYFNLLRPGYYQVRTVVQGYLGRSDIFLVEAGRTIPPQTISYGLPIYNISTLPDAGTISTDSMISVYTSADVPILSNYDVGELDTAQVALLPGTYKVRILPYGPYIGEYALWVGPTPYPFATAPGTFAAPILAGSQSHALAAPQPINLMQIYNCNLTAAGDFYTLTIP